VITPVHRNITNRDEAVTDRYENKWKKRRSKTADMV
jgi:hypothetical protein